MQFGIFIKPKFYPLNPKHSNKKTKGTIFPIYNKIVFHKKKYENYLNVDHQLKENSENFHKNHIYGPIKNLYLKFLTG